MYDYDMLYNVPDCGLQILQMNMLKRNYFHWVIQEINLSIHYAL